MSHWNIYNTFGDCKSIKQLNDFRSGKQWGGHEGAEVDSGGNGTSGWSSESGVSGQNFFKQDTEQFSRMFVRQECVVIEAKSKRTV